MTEKINAELFATLLNVKVGKDVPEAARPFLDDAARVMDSWWKARQDASGGSPSPQDIITARHWGVALVLRADLDASAPNPWDIDRPTNGQIHDSPVKHYIDMSVYMHMLHGPRALA